MGSSLSIIMPALNAEHTLRLAVATTTHALARAGISDYEIIILVNTRQDGTHDRSDEIAEELVMSDHRVRLIDNRRFYPFGTTYWQGVEAATKDFVMFVPSDDETTEDSLTGIVSAAGMADIVVPFTINPQVRTLKRRLVSRAFVVICNALFGLHLKYYNGLCIVGRKMILQVPLRSKSFAYMVQVLVFLIKSGATYVEVPMAIKPTTASASFKLKSVAEALRALTELFWLVRIKNTRIRIH